MEFCDQGSLEKYFQKHEVPEKKVAYFISDIIAVVKHLHSIDIVHRDLKPENFLIKSNDGSLQVKLADFGTARIIGTHGSTVIGTRLFMAPEICVGLEEMSPGGIGTDPAVGQSKHDEKVDIFSLGLIVECMIRHKSKENLQPIMSKILKHIIDLFMHKLKACCQSKQAVKSHN